MKAKTAAILAISTYTAIVLGSIAVSVGIYIGVAYVIIHFVRKAW